MRVSQVVKAVLGTSPPPRQTPGKRTQRYFATPVITCWHSCPVPYAWDGTLRHFLVAISKIGMRLHGGGQGFDSPAVHHSSAGESWPTSPPRDLPRAPLQPSCNPNACAQVGMAEVRWRQLWPAPPRPGTVSKRLNSTPYGDPQ